ncbi:MAG: TrlF family AAA-like ATPase [Pseudomonadota bacterium]
MTDRVWGVGSRWLRWEPHLHAPGTLRNDGFGGDWDAYFAAITSAKPAPVALGITDYFSLRTYREFQNRRPTSLGSVSLVFPNVEMRLTVETRRGHGVNLHLLISPEDPDHVVRAEEKLAQLTFEFRRDRLPCTDDGLRRLGRAQPGNGRADDATALREGANQFKVDLQQLRSLFERDDWVRRNMLVAVAAGNDGLAGLARDAAFRAQREELGRFADVVFSGSPGDREYWLGHHPDFESNAQTPKPCLHGSDAHEIAAVLQPDHDRRCWIKGDATFESLRQTRVEPEHRAHIGAEPPPEAPGAGIIRELRATDAPWLQTPAMALNSGLVTIIGAKGSEKTALADLVALAADAQEIDPGPASFLAKARPLLGSLRVELAWADGEETSNERDSVDWMWAAEPRVQYLSQQFVERLSSPDDLTEPLLAEIERVVYSAIPDEERLRTADFDELRGLILQDSQASAEHERSAIRKLTDEIAAEQELIRAVPKLETALAAATRTRQNLETNLAQIPVPVDDTKAKAVQAAATELQGLRNAIATADRRGQEIADVTAEAKRQLIVAEEDWRGLRRAHPDLLDDATWDLLRPMIANAGFDTLAQLEKAARSQADALRTRGLAALQDVADQADATPRSLAWLVAEHERLVKELGLDEAKALRRAQLQNQLPASLTVEANADRDLKHARGASDRLREAQRRRLASYGRVFEALVQEQEALERLYRPLRDRISEEPRLGKLSFTVGRVVDLQAWSTRGEALFDLRTPPFQGHGKLLEAARTALLEPWRTGDPSTVVAAMDAFLGQHFKTPLVLAQGASLTNVGEWLFSTDHIRVRYGVEYEGVPISRLSPGTRGVVLLTLYLGLDQWDRRPLVIDQPEENLDPSSVYDSLVPFFREAALRRQILMVTHNANLVVNTDSDQVIVADSRRSSPKELPDITYVAGGLEDPAIRDAVCRLLEGGEAAFRRRGERYGLTS